MSTFLENINKAFEDSENNLCEKRTIAYQRFLHQGFPTIKDEEWRFSNLKSSLSLDYNLNLSKKSLPKEDISPYWVPNLDSYKITFINGYFSEEFSSLPSDIDFKPIHQYTENEIYKKYLNTILKSENGLVSLNSALSRHGYFLHIKDNQIIEKPIEIVFLLAEEKESFYQPKNLIVVGKNTKLSIIESYVSLHHQPHFINAVTELFAYNNSKINLYKTQNEKAPITLIDQVFSQQERDTEISVNTLSFGGKFIRNNLNFKQLGEGCNSLMQAVTIGENKQLIDHHTLVEHTAAHCESHELYRTILNDEAKGVFNGRIIVDPEAQKIDAFQQNNNVLLSDTASINTKPQLEIFADDVKCSHGCTVGQLDKSALFYMQQRGIPTKEAKAFLLYAFCADVLSSIPIQPLKEHWAYLLAKKLDVDITF